MTSLPMTSGPEHRSGSTQDPFHLLVDSFEDYAILMLDTQGHVTSWNRGAQSITGYTEAEVLGRHFSLFYPPEDVHAGTPDLALRLAARDGRFEDEGWRLRMDGSRFWANAVITALRGASGELIGFGKITRDLTERRAAEEARLRLARTEEAVLLRDDFLQVASHELKTPLTALRMQVQDAKNKLWALPADRLRRMERVQRSADRLVVLVDHLLDLSLLGQGHLQLDSSPEDLASLTREWIERLGSYAARQGCELSLIAPGPVMASVDRLRIEQAVVNLVGNAIKYGAGSPVEVEVVAGPPPALVVRDRGPGVPPEDRQRIFDRFERAVSPRNFGGLGLGLYLTRQIAEAHGGSVEVQERPGGGSVFILTLRDELTPPVPAGSDACPP